MEWLSHSIISHGIYTILIEYYDLSTQGLIKLQYIDMEIDVDSDPSHGCNIRVSVADLNEEWYCKLVQMWVQRGLHIAQSIRSGDYA